MKKNYIFSTSKHILETVYVPGDTISGMPKVNTKASNSIFGFYKILYCLEKITILPNLWSISFIENGSLLRNTVLILCDEGDGLVAVSLKNVNIQISWLLMKPADQDPHIHHHNESI